MTTEAPEAAIGRHLVDGQFDAATTVTLQLYGPELLGFLRGRLSDMEKAREVFAWVAEDLWRGMPRFRRESSVRTWAYAIARNAAYRYGKQELRERMQGQPLSQLSRASALAVQLPTSPSTQSAAEQRVAALRDRLDDEEQTILSLRVDRSMDWQEVALVMLFNGDQPAAEELEREVARLRKRFQYIKQKLRKWVSEAPKG